MRILAYAVMALGMVYILVPRLALALHAVGKRLQGAEARPDWRWHIARILIALTLILMGLWILTLA